MALLVGGALMGCRTAPVPAGPGPQAAAACVIAGDGSREHLNVTVPHAVDPANAPAPRNQSERLIFRQLYDTLVRVDCEGRLLPGLAESWSADEQGGAWQFRLREDASFWDGTRITALDIVQNWATNSSVAARTSATIAGMAALGERELRVELRSATPNAHIFAHPDFGIARPRADAAWPVGSGPFRTDLSADRRVIRMVPRVARTTAPRSIEFRTLESADPRSALDAGSDVLVTADAAALDYARALPDYRVTPLAWSRTYTLVTRGTQSAGDSVAMPMPDALRALARDAVRADTRVAEPPFWWRHTDCWAPLSAEGTPTAAAARPAIVYPRSDAIARGIAERLVALAWPATRAPVWLRAVLPADYARAGVPVALGFDQRALLEAIRSSSAMAYVVPLPRSGGPACVAPTLADDALSLALAASPALRILPLLDARDYLVHRRGLGPVIIEGDGTLRFTSGMR